MVGKFCGTFTCLWPNPTPHPCISAVVLKMKDSLCSQHGILVPDSGESRIDLSLKELYLELWEGPTLQLAFLKHTVKQKTSYELPVTARDKILQRPTIGVPKAWEKKLKRQIL